MNLKRTFSLLMFTVMVVPALTKLHAQTQQEIVFDTTHLFAAEEQYGIPVYEENDGKKHYLIAFTGAAITECLIGGWDRWVAKADWAKVGWNDVIHFYDRPLQFDNDWYWTNFVLHPYQGALSYLAGRSANLNRIESMILTAMGDAAWEFFFELNQPSINDLVYSWVGAFAVGEMFYRLSFELDQIHQLLGYVLNPERVWPLLWTRKRTRGTYGNIYALSTKFSIGTTAQVTKLNGETDWERFPVFVQPQMYIVYNDPYGHDSNAPYSQFELEFGFALGPGSGRGRESIEEKMMYEIFIFSNGMLLSRAPEWGENRDTTIGFVFDYDFMWHSFMEFSSLAPGVAIKQRINYDNSSIEWQAHADFNLLGTSDYPELRRRQVEGMLGRDYNYGFGPELVGAWKWASHKGYAVSADVHAYANYSFQRQVDDCESNGNDTSTGWDLFAVCRLDCEMPLSDLVRLGVENQLYIKKGLYTDAQNAFQAMYAASVYAKLQLK